MGIRFVSALFIIVIGVMISSEPAIAKEEIVINGIPTTTDKGTHMYPFPGSIRNAENLKSTPGISKLIAQQFPKPNIGDAGSVQNEIPVTSMNYYEQTYDFGNHRNAKSQTPNNPQLQTKEKQPTKGFFTVTNIVVIVVVTFVLLLTIWMFIFFRFSGCKNCNKRGDHESNPEPAVTFQNEAAAPHVTVQMT